MSDLERNSIAIKIGINKNHIENFVLETDEGTKKIRNSFRKKAANDRNDYINNQHILFDKYCVEIKNEMSERIKSKMPSDKTDIYNEKQKYVDNLFELVQLYSKMPDSFKLKYDFLISSIRDDTSLEELVNIIRKFIEQFHILNINLSLEDFKYTMFTEDFMSTFFASNDFDLIKEKFENIFFKCPDIKLQLKMNLKHILEYYHKEISEYVVSLRTKLSSDYYVHEDNVVEKYVMVRKELGEAIAKDEYYNIKVFLNGEKNISDYFLESAIREKNYNTFSYNGNYASLNELEKEHFSSAMMGFYITLNEFRKYYKYEFIIKDLLNKHKQKDNIKNLFISKKKEYEKEEIARSNLYKEYLKNCGIGFLAKRDEQKVKDSMLKMNEQVRKIDNIRNELNDLEISYNLSELADSSSIYDLFITSLTSFSFLEKCFIDNDDFNGNFEDTVFEYLRFIYNPCNSILRKINAFTNNNIGDILADKYRLLNLNITPEMVDSDNIDKTLEMAEFINLIQNIEASNMDINTISNIYKMYQIIHYNSQEHSSII